MFGPKKRQLTASLFLAGVCVALVACTQVTAPMHGSTTDPERNVTSADPTASGDPGKAAPLPPPIEHAQEQPEATELPPAVVSDVAAALNSADENEQLKIVAPNIRNSVLEPLLPAGTKVTPVGGTIAHDNRAEMTVELTGEKTGKYIIKLVNISGEWFAYGTEEQPK